MLIKRHHRKVTFIVMFTESQVRRRKINDILRSGDAYKSIPTPSLPLHSLCPPPPPTSPPCLTHTHTPLLSQNTSKSKLYPLARDIPVSLSHQRTLHWPTLTSLSKPRRSVNANFLFLFPFWIMQRTFS